MTMVDEKVNKAATATTSTSKCYKFGATSMDFNQLEKKPNFEATNFGFFILRVWI